MPDGAPTRGANREAQARRLVIWRFSDGKAGHDNQSLGLAEAVAGTVNCEIHSLTPIGPVMGLLNLVTGRAFANEPYSDPDLILGAGHATHLSMLAARRSRGGRVIVLMTPTLPKKLFDLCLIPEHDGPGNGRNVIVTVGALNRVRSRADKEASSGLILLGGPSPHFDFDQQKVIAQIEAVLKDDPAISWSATTSRRTPSDLAASLRALGSANLNVVPVDETAPGWLAAKLGRTERVWVTEDSASMVYEALSGGAAVGLLTLEGKRPGRISRGIEQLEKSGRVTRFEQWLNGSALKPADTPINESERCARLILDRFPDIDPRR